MTSSTKNLAQSYREICEQQKDDTQKFLSMTSATKNSAQSYKEISKQQKNDTGQLFNIKKTAYENKEDEAHRTVANA